MADEMTTPMVLGIIGGILILIMSLVTGIWVATLGSVFGPFGAAFTTFGLAMAILGFAAGLIILIGSFLMQGPRAKTGSILVLIFGILGFFTPAAGIVIGPILAILGGALGLSKVTKK